MAVAHSAASESHTGTTGSTNQAAFSWTHTQTGTPQGVVVFVSTFLSTADLITSVTYGGVALTRLSGGSAQDAAGEAGRCDAFFLGSGLGTGNQTITVNRTNNATAMYASAATVTAGADTAVPTATIVLLQGDGTLAVQSVNDTSPGQNSVRYAGAYSGLNAPPAAGTGSTLLNSIDIGNYGSALVRETTAGQGARNVGFTGATDDRAAVHLAIRELVPRTETPIVGAFTLTGNDATLEKRVPAVLGADLGKFFLPERNLVRYSEQFEDAYWGKAFTGTGLAPVVTANDAAAPDGTLTADKIVLDLNGGTAGTDRSDINAGTSTNSVIGKTYIFSVWLKTTDGSSLSVQLSLNGASVSLVTVTGTWQRFTSATRTAEDTSRRPRFGLRGGTGSASFASLHAWGLQWEEGTSITDYDPTGPAGATDAALRQAHLLDGGTGSFTLTGQPADARHNVRIEGGTGAFSLAGNDATLVKASAKAIAVDAGTFALTGNDATLKQGYALAGDRGAFTLTGNPATLADTDRIEAGTGAFTLGGNPAALKKGYALAGGTGAFTFTGNPATLTKAAADELTPIVGAFTLSGNAAALKRSWSLAGDRGAFTLTGQAATLARSRLMTGARGQFLLSGNQASLIVARAMLGSRGAFTFTGNPATLADTDRLAAELGAFTFTGNAASLAKSGAGGRRRNVLIF